MDATTTAGTPAAKEAVNASAEESIRKGLQQGIEQRNGASATETAAKEIAKPNPAKEEKPDELTALREEVAKLRTETDATRTRREAEDATNDFLREFVSSPNNQGISRELLKQVLPISADKKILQKATEQLAAHLKSFVDHEVLKGRLRWVNVGGASGDGGITPSNHVQSQSHEKASAFDSVQEGLRTAQRR